MASAPPKTVQAREPEPTAGPAVSLPDLLAGIHRPGTFAVRRRMAGDELALEVRGVGRIPLPVSAATARRLRQVARPARHGYKDETRLDRSVRDTWEIARSRIRIDARRWNAALRPELDAIRAGLGLAPHQTLRAELHNMLVYTAGQFFLPHQDSEKSDDMVATLVVSLPSDAKGGALVVEHHDERKTFRGTSAGLTLVAFYADCRHEVRPVTAGHRIVLTYNLLLSGGADAALALPAGERLDALERGVRTFLETPATRPWPRAPSSPPDRLVYLLDHEYSRKSLGWHRLKNGDAVRVAALREVAERLDCEIVLALADVHETWSCEDHGDAYYGGRRRRSYLDLFEDDEEDEGEEEACEAEGGALELGELCDWSVELRHFVGLTGRAPAVSGDVASAELCYTKPSVEFDPFKSEHEGYMGNWGNTVDRWYHRAAVVLWPRERSFLLRAKASAWRSRSRPSGRAWCGTMRARRWPRRRSASGSSCRATSSPRSCSSRCGWSS
jgi:hypothetical protein